MMRVGLWILSRKIKMREIHSEKWWDFVWVANNLTV